MTTESYVQVQPDSTGKKVRTVEVTEASQTVEQQVVTIADGVGTELSVLAGVIATAISMIISGALVGDTPPQSYLDGEARPLSMTNEGRLRVSTTPAHIEVNFFQEGEESMWRDEQPFERGRGDSFGEW